MATVKIHQAGSDDFGAETPARRIVAAASHAVEVMDEPTAALQSHDIENLYARLGDDGNEAAQLGVLEHFAPTPRDQAEVELKNG